MQSNFHLHDFHRKALFMLLVFTTCIVHLGDGLEERRRGGERETIFVNTLLTSAWKAEQRKVGTPGSGVLTDSKFEKKKEGTEMFFLSRPWKSMRAEDKKQRNYSLCPYGLSKSKNGVKSSLNFERSNLVRQKSNIFRQVFVDLPFFFLSAKTVFIIAIRKKSQIRRSEMPFFDILRLQGDHYCAYAEK